VAEVFGDLAGATAVEVRVLPRGTSLEQYQTSRYIPLAKAGTAVVTVVGYDGSFDPAALARQPAGATPARLLAGIRATLAKRPPVPRSRSWRTGPGGRCT
jgi:hypothetical protein